jgi:hypothetical protein
MKKKGTPKCKGIKIKTSDKKKSNSKRKGLETNTSGKKSNSNIQNIKDKMHEGDFTKPKTRNC